MFQLPLCPTSIKLIRLPSLRGLVVCMSERGNVRITYMGTDPPSRQVAQETKDLDYEAMEAEHFALVRRIRGNRGQESTDPNDRVMLRVMVPDCIEYSGRGSTGISDIVVGHSHDTGGASALWLFALTALLCSFLTN